MKHLLGVNVGVLALLLAVGVLSPRLQAQTGSISGTVSDSSGAVVQGAAVSVRHLGTGETHATKSGANGGYTIINLPVGDYEVTAKQTSFKTFRMPSVTLTVAQALTLNVELIAGAATEEVTVRADSASPVDLETSQVSNLVDQQQMKDLPLITRDPYSLVLLSPGTSQTNAMGGFTVNGARERNNNFLLDGVDNNDTSVPGIPDGVLSANPDSTQEFRVITNNFNAEYGRNTGAIIDVVTKSGTNSFHGGVYEFGRWNGFGGARDWFNPAIDASGTATKMNPYVRNQFGYSIGGPIFKNKTFFFFNEEFERFRTTLTNSSTVPTAAFKTGVFNYTTVDQNSDPQHLQTVTVPVDLTATGANNGAFGADLDATMKKVFALYPNPTIDNGDGFTGTLQFPSGSKQNSYNTVAKIDHHFTDRESLTLRYGYDHFFDPNPFHNDILPGNVGGVSSKSINQGLSATLTSTLTNNLVNNLTFGWNKIYANFDCTGISTVDSPIPSTDQYGNGWDFNMDPFTSVGCTALVSDGQWRKTGTTSYTDNISWVHGNHTFKFGGDFRNIGEQGPNSFFSRRQVGLASFANAGVALAAGVNDGSSNDISSLQLQDAASAYYGFVWEDFNAEFFNKAAVRQGTDNKHFRQHEYDWFGQDTWKVRRNLTLTLGLRYQLDGVPYEEGANFSNLLESPTSVPPLTMTTVGPGTGKQIYNSDYSNIEPRVGFSWDPWGNGKTAVRAAFGVFHDRVFGNLFGNARGNPPFEQDYVTFPFDTINNFFGTGAFALPAVPDTVPSPIIPDGALLSPVLFDTHFRNSASNNWNVGIQRELPGSNVIDIAYVGSEGHHIYREVDGNPPDPALVQQLLAFCVPSNPLNMGFPRDVTPSNPNGQCSADTVIKNNLYFGAGSTLPFNAIAHNALFQPFYQVSVGNSIYNSLQAKITHRLSHGLQVQGSYTWAHGIDDSNDPLVPAAGNRGFPRNSRNLGEERGNSDNDIRQVAVINYAWEVPLGKGKGYLNTGAAGKIFEGMQFAGITTVQTGHPFDVFSSTDMERTGLTGRADLVAGQNPFGTAGGNNTPGLKTWFNNTNAFSLRSDGSGAPLFDGPGNIGRNHFYGPGFVDFDLVFAKQMKFTERFNAELRVEGYNIFNHPHFNNPANTVGGTNFGQISSTVGRPDATTSARQLQVALKLNF